MRYPTAPELEVMTLLSVNHGAKGITMWNYPTTSDLFNLTGDLSTLFASGTAANFLIGSPRTQDLPVSGDNNLDAAVWVDQASAKAMLSVVNLDYENTSGPVTVNLPTGVTAETVEGGLWGASTWQVGSNGTAVSAAAGLGGLEVAVFVLGIS